MPRAITKDGKRKRAIDPRPGFVTTQSGEKEVPSLNSLPVAFVYSPENIKLRLTWQGQSLTFMNSNRFAEWPKTVLRDRVLLAAACSFCREFYDANRVEKHKSLREKTMVKQVFNKWRKEQKAWEPVLCEPVQMMEVWSVMGA